jgi:hypothetical protein
VTDREHRVEAYRRRLAAQAQQRGASSRELSKLLQAFLRYHAVEMVKIEIERGTTTSDFEELAQVGALKLLARIDRGLKTRGVDREDPKRRLLVLYMASMLRLEEP